ncbi:hypothetical protein D6D19_02948 [Aureobasidium pullulans]|uniref:Uncharacterized protein n=1 Tax=Aureobasidium pullulans TaxID=5580 RepID=A0A4S9IN70_AURPU|nr:hypothetical protein D6D19_02948 [Aureobasidium pullulans]THX58502.1 hypothetical protein D6D06_02879 [Aureobasidium pullulans]THX89936.1 hypothetical protein D6D05_00851 [Aureobasidium pullulans]THY58641.1 hypothetical protein D6C97_04355 [Aureobasidium pullulans]TIA13306.1 hypothetical protein D6C80_06326 [Aureobasidium pullulans]
MDRAAGFVTGGVAGVIRNSPPLLFALGSSIQWFGLGTTFWGTRSFIFQAWDTGKGLTRSDKVSASTIAGGVAGSGVGLLTRGPRNAIPGAIMFSLFGFLGQTVSNRFDKSDMPVSDEPQLNFWQKFASLKWMPVTVLNDGEYENMLRERQLKLEAEIALVDERIEALKAQNAQAVPAKTSAS